MTNWNGIAMLTNGLKHLGTSINVAYPKRKVASDGAIGDYAHTLEKSGHNPDDTSRHNAEWDGDSDNKPEIRAIDVDKDLDPTTANAAQELVDHIVGLKPSTVLRYVIYNRRIWEASNDWKPRTYTGASAHTEHIHFSGAYSNASDENTTFDYGLDELTMNAQDVVIALYMDIRRNPDTTDPDGQSGLNKVFRQIVAEEVAKQLKAVTVTPK